MPRCGVFQLRDKNGFAVLVHCQNKGWAKSNFKNESTGRPGWLEKPIRSASDLREKETEKAAIDTKASHELKARLIKSNYAQFEVCGRHVTASFLEAYNNPIKHAEPC